MSVYLFWGEDDFAMNEAIAALKKAVLDPNWIQFNLDQIPGESPDPVIQALNQAMTPPFGMGGRLVWLEETTLFQQCSDSLLQELQRTLPNLPPTSTLLFSCRKKPDGRNKATKLLQKHADIREFSLIPPWNTDAILKKVRQQVQEKGLRLTPKAVQVLAESVGNDTRFLYGELEKLRLYSEGNPRPLDESAIARLVVANTQNSLQLAAAIRDGKTPQALGLVSDLLNRNEPALRIVATLIGQFRTWLIVKLMMESGERDEKAIASAADISNPKRIYFLRKEVQSLSSDKLLAALPLFLDLELSLKRGADPLETLERKVVELCAVCQGGY
ncbi:DNA polymerase III subunit delta [Spirulina subsalsa]|uniref:DNA polymerase III subunit delta n=1 Tax=Spirulina subsalsa TaxID=54311 RepID=UPI0003611B45|nr:DNA polymerase III subunit delta [Spirulina subsalsa]